MCMCVFSIIRQSVFHASVANELACFPCLCAAIVSGLSGYCIPDMWYIQCRVIHSYQHLLSTSADSERSD